MKFLTLEAKLVCKHVTGVVQFHTHWQDLVRIAGSPVLVENDPQVKMITGCANIGMTIKPCTLTVDVEKGYSEFIRIQGRKVCLETITGLTDGTPPGSVKYTVQLPGQNFVSEVR
jgi:hypothetical protein